MSYYQPYHNKSHRHRQM